MPRRLSRNTPPRESEAEQPPLAALAAAPLANPLHIFLPGGRPRRARSKPDPHEQMALFGALPAKPKMPRKMREESERLQKVERMLDHYATTTVPLAEVASHCLISPEQARAGLKRRGRDV